GGDFTTIDGTTATRIARIKPDGSLDTAFAAAGGHGSTVQDLALQADGNVLLAGNFANFQGSADSRPLWRLVPGLAGLPGVLRFSADAFTGAEGTSASLTVTRTGGSLGNLTLGYATAHGGGGTATPATDYTVTTSALTWANGDAAAKTLTIPLALDASADTPETLLVNLGAPQLGGALLGDRQQAVVTIRTAYAAWQASRFTASELADSAVAGDTADPDADGLNNLTEFALSREPRVADSAAAWTTAVQNVSGTNYLTITFRRRTPALDLAYAVQSTADLAATGTWTANAVQVGTATANGDGTETVTYRDIVASNTAPRRFLRVSVTRTP
ncbi:MAG: Calx-beta domain-containing protein, partial [Akkermansiaceae bacterium]|nr:Calx-beta domain-containing protein [Akkermansiaceae bacterium]